VKINEKNNGIKKCMQMHQDLARFYALAGKWRRLPHSHDLKSSHQELTPKTRDHVL
jgi:hypothetical protein